ncbi:ParB/RepB/Spo0J family plasmid partition protein [Salmonella enterica subsp. enterica serovar Durham]|nr:ParB/RepB/Spo0J family plasmid partition protein [Salmonella enterica subsp. enterica serovar Durham]
MKRAPLMKNAPDIKIERPAGAPRDENHAPAAPAVAHLRERVSAMRGDSVSLKINGRDVTFNLKVIPSERVEQTTLVYAGNERDQELLTESSLGDILPTFRAAGQQFPAFGRNINGLIEIADGSRRRAAAIISGREYRVLVGDLRDEDMKWLTKLGNDYQATSAYERGKRYARLLKHQYGNNISQLANDEGVSRKIITRNVKVATLPVEVIRAFPSPGDLSAKSGEALAELLPNYRDELIRVANWIAERRQNGEDIDGEKTLTELKSVVGKPSRPDKAVREYGQGIKMIYKGGKIAVDLAGAPEGLIKDIERLLEKHKESTEAADAAAAVNLSLDKLGNVLKLIRDAAKVRGIKLTPNEEQALIVGARAVMAKAGDYDDMVNQVGNLITRTFVK